MDVTAPLDNGLEVVPVGIAGLLLAGGMIAVDEVKVKLGIEMGIDREGRPVEPLDCEEIVAELDPIALVLVLVLALVLALVLLGTMGRSELNNEGKRPSEVLLADADADVDENAEVAVGITADE